MSYTALTYTVKLRIYHRLPKLRLYVPETIVLDYLKVGRPEKIFINNVDVTGRVYYAGYRDYRLVIPNDVVQQLNLKPGDTITLTVHVIRPEVISYHHVVYASYQKEKTPEKDVRKFEVHIFSERELSVEEAIEEAKSAFLDALGSDYEIIWSLLYLRYVGWERIPVEVKGYIVIDFKQHYAPYYWTDISLEKRAEIIKWRFNFVNVDVDEKNIARVRNIISSTRLLIPDKVEKIQVYTTRHGFHVRILLREWLKSRGPKALEENVAENLRLREAFGDDAGRIGFDETKYSIHESLWCVCDVLFYKKYDVETKEWSIETFYREYIF